MPKPINAYLYLLSGALLVMLTVPTRADVPEHWYVSAGIGWSYAETVAFNEVLSESPGDTGGTVNFDFAAPVGSAALGVAFDNDWRLELEGAHRYNDVEILYFPDSGLEVDPEASDKVQVTSLLANLLRDFELGTALRPYIGVGIGAAEVRYRVGETSIDFPSRERPRRPIIDDEATALAFQLIAGFTIPLSARFEMAGDYRYLQAPSVHLRDAGARKLDTDHVMHSAWLSLRYYPGAGARSLTSPRAAIAPQRGFYLAGSLGTQFATDAEIHDNLANFDAFDIGPLATLATGYAAGDRWRFELEAATRKSAAEIIDFNPQFGEDRATGRVRATSLMTNAIYRFYPRAAIGPYFGLGAGLVWADYDVDARGATFVDDNDRGLAYQAITGVDIALSPRLTLAAEYRFWITGALKMQQPDGQPLQTDHHTHSMTLGLRFALAGRR